MSGPGVSVYRFPRGGIVLDRIDPESSCIVFFISGKVRVTGNALIKCTLSSGSMMLLPKNAPVHGVTLTACEFVTCLLPDSGMEIESFFRRLRPFLTSDFDYRFVTLPVDPLLESYAKMIRLVCSRIEVTEDFSRMKLRELFFLSGDSVQSGGSGEVLFPSYWRRQL